MELLFYVLLALTSIIVLTFIIERGLALQAKKVVPRDVATAVNLCRTSGDVPKLREVCERIQAPLSRLLLVAADHLHWPRSANVDVLQTRARHEVALLERGLVVLEIVVGIAPLLGLAGTVYGLITLFGSLGGQGVADNAGFARGIGIAMYATLAGLMIAIPALVAWSYYTKKVETLALEMENLCDEFLRNHYRDADHSVLAPSGAAVQPGITRPMPAPPPPPSH
jgi:biopolymer transport protein ExbB